MNMNITSAKYVNSPLTGQPSSIKAIIDGQEWSIPIAPGNRHYDEIIAQGIVPEPYVEPAPTKNQQESLRQAAYTAETDPLFFKYQRGEATQEDWLAKIAEIKIRYPYPEETINE